jgi:hypothetical protein
MAKSESNKAVANLIQWMQREAIWASRFDALMMAHIESTLNANALTTEQLRETLGVADSQLFGCVFEHLCAERFDEAPNNFVDDYLKRRGWRDSIPSRRYMVALRDASLNLYEITAVQQGAWVEIKDLVQNAPTVRIREHSGSMNMVRWDKIAARVVNYQGEKLFTGVLIRYSTEQVATLMDVINHKVDIALDAKNMTRANANVANVADAAVVSQVITDTLLSLTAAFTINWLGNYFAARHAPRPPIFNFEGDPIHFTETHFVLEASANTRASVIARLDQRDDMRRVDDAPPTWDWLSHDLKAAPFDKAGGGSSFQTIDSETGAHVLAMMTLETDALLLTTNSLTRMQNGIAMLDVALAGLIKTKSSSTTTVDEMLKRRPKNEGRDTEKKIPPHIAEKIRHEYFDKHYQDWLDSPLPGLDGRTPRQAVQTKPGQDEVVELLKMMENLEARNSGNTGGSRYDFGWVWEALGLLQRRN